MNNQKKVDDFLNKLDHPLKREMEAVREIIAKANSKIEEDVKWGGPSFFYKEDMATFSPRVKDSVALVFHKGDLLNGISDLLEEASKGKAYVKLSNMEAVKANKTELEKIVNAWVKLMDEK
ncbi:MAG TPA: DUF1801 domain-containing protein [Cytophagales bacterium]|nr:DUF1801 domain-containing protein [Cytophagales bacterium]